MTFRVSPPRCADTGYCIGDKYFAKSNIVPPYVEGLIRQKIRDEIAGLDAERAEVLVKIRSLL